MSNLTFNKDCIKPNIPLKWQVKFEESEMTRRINQSTYKQQPKVREILDMLEQIEYSEHIQRQVDDFKNQRNHKRKERHKRDRKNMCRIPGHNHKWKDCPMNRANAKRQENNVNEKGAHRDDDNIIEQEDFSIVRENNILNFVEDSSDNEVSTKDSTTVLDINNVKGMMSQIQKRMKRNPMTKVKQYMQVAYLSSKMKMARHRST